MTPATAELCRCGSACNCTHCHDDPPAGHTCPRCGATTTREDTR